MTFDGVGQVDCSLDPESAVTTAATGFNRSPDSLQNTIAMYEMTAPANKPALMMTVLMRRGGGGATRTDTPPVGFTMALAANHGVFAGSTYAFAFATKMLKRGEASGPGTWSNNGAADMRFTTFSYLFTE